MTRAIPDNGLVGHWTLCSQLSLQQTKCYLTSQETLWETPRMPRRGTRTEFLLHSRPSYYAQELPTTRYKCLSERCIMVAVWRSGNAFGHINEVNLHQSWLVLVLRYSYKGQGPHHQWHIRCLSGL